MDVPSTLSQVARQPPPPTEEQVSPASASQKPYKKGSWVSGSQARTSESAVQRKAPGRQAEQKAPSGLSMHSGTSPEHVSSSQLPPTHTPAVAPLQRLSPSAHDGELSSQAPAPHSVAATTKINILFHMRGTSFFSVYNRCVRLSRHSVRKREHGEDASPPHRALRAQGDGLPRVRAQRNPRWLMRAFSTLPALKVALKALVLKAPPLSTREAVGLAGPRGSRTMEEATDL